MLLAGTTSAQPLPPENFNSDGRQQFQPGIEIYLCSEECEEHVVWGISVPHPVPACGHGRRPLGFLMELFLLLEVLRRTCRNGP